MISSLGKKGFLDGRHLIRFGALFGAPKEQPAASKGSDAERRRKGTGALAADFSIHYSKVPAPS
jgi:hypothetical protein